MTDNLREVLNIIGEENKNNINKDARNYLEISIAKKAAELGYPETTEQFKDACAIVPLKRPVKGMKVRIDGRTFVNYAQFASGIVVPNYVAMKADLPYSAYIARDSMIYNYT